MPKTKELCEATKAAILALLEIGMSERQVAKKTEDLQDSRSLQQKKTS